eukprot:scaffold5570_cov87-Skeletonema_dohrnii-CCMP3373.AAC.11
MDTIIIVLSQRRADPSRFSAAVIGGLGGALLTERRCLQYRVCQFKYKLDTTSDGEYIVLQAGSWEKGGTSFATVTGGAQFDLFKAGHVVRDGTDARINAIGGRSLLTANSFPLDDVTGIEDEFNPAIPGPVFASNGHLLVKKDRTCVNLAINPEDYFKSSPAVKGCQKYPTLCTPCQGGATSKIVNGKSQCVVDGNSNSEQGIVVVEFEVAMTLDGIEAGSTLSDELASLQLPQGAGLRIVSIGGVSLTGRLLEAKGQGLLVILLLTLVANCSEETCDDSREALLEETGDLSMAITTVFTDADGSLSA